MSVSRGRILIVDDDPDIVEVLGDQLEAEGFEVVSASNGAEGLRRIRLQRTGLGPAPSTLTRQRR